MDSYLYNKKLYTEMDRSEQYGGALDTSLNRGVEIYKKVLIKTSELEKIYESFWTNVYYNDAYVFYKNAIEFYKNIQNNKMHSFFSGRINKKLYDGSCQYIDAAYRTEFSNNPMVHRIDIDDLCALSVQVINILDMVFSICPKIPQHMVVYRSEHRDRTDGIFGLKKGDMYKSLGYNCTTINPFYGFYKSFRVDRNKLSIRMTIYLPPNTCGYYMIHPFGIIPVRMCKKHIYQRSFNIAIYFAE